MDGTPNGISVPRWSWSSTHLKGSRPWASLSLNCRLSRVSGSIWRRTRSKSTASARRARSSSAQAAARGAGAFFAKLAPCVVDGGLLVGASLGAAIAGGLLRGQADPASACKTVCSAQQVHAADAAALRGHMHISPLLLPPNRPPCPAAIGH